MRVLPHLLNEEFLPDIAQALNKSVHTVREYAKNIYDKYGVNGRIGLMELWLNPLMSNAFK